MFMQKRLILLLTLISIIGHSAFSEEFTKDVPAFSRIIASPRINVILTEGEKESVQLLYYNITPDKINIEVTGNTLRIYLDDARVTEKTIKNTMGGREGIYEGVEVTAFVTYRSLRHLEIRGNQELTCKSALHSDKLVVKAYGENEINLLSVETGYLKTRLYGENRLKIKGGRADYQKYKLYGENRIDSQDLKSYNSSATMFGESKLRIYSQDELRITSFGESTISYEGDAHVNRGLVFGNTEITKIN